MRTVPKINKINCFLLAPLYSRLPVVVYAPEGVEMRYRVWRAGPETKVIEKG